MLGGAAWDSPLAANHQAGSAQNRQRLVERFICAEQVAEHLIGADLWFVALQYLAGKVNVFAVPVPLEAGDQLVCVVVGVSEPEVKSSFWSRTCEMADGGNLKQLAERDDLRDELPGDRDRLIPGPG